MTKLQEERAVLKAAVLEAGALAQASFGGPLTVEDKPDDQGPVSEVDRACDQLLRQRLATAFPQDAILSEESEDDGHWHQAHRVWMIDPIDGTQEYVTGVDQFAVMVGLCIDGQPQLGGVFAPAQDTLLLGTVGEGATATYGALRNPHSKPLCLPQHPKKDHWRVAVSRSHPSAKVDLLCRQLGSVEQKKIGSVGLKISSVSHGETDLYMATTNRIKLWDTCGPQAVLNAAGGTLVDLLGQPLEYRRDLHHPNGLLASADSLIEHLVSVLSHHASEFYQQ